MFRPLVYFVLEAVALTLFLSESFPAEEWGFLFSGTVKLDFEFDLLVFVLFVIVLLLLAADEFV